MIQDIAYKFIDEKHRAAALWLTTFFSTLYETHQKTWWVRLPFLNAPLLKLANLHTVTCLPGLKDTLNKQGIHELECNDCDAIYVGQWSRALHVRLKEYYEAVLKIPLKNQPLHSKFSQVGILSITSP